ncbi:MAG: DUF4276 family protein [Nitrosomonas sp.]|nr:MAG: DUF4276 family protein [Nitrosomonas sp.]
MKELVFLLEEDSAAAMLESLLPRILHSEIKFRLIPFEGKQDLEKQMLKRIRGYQNLHACFVVLRDQDSEPDCTVVKAKLLARCQQTGKAEKVLVRIACKELESFYLADLEAVEKGLSINKLTTHQKKRKFREPDLLGNPGRELIALTGGKYQKVSGSRAIGKFLDPENVCSHSFKNLILGIRHLENELLEL